MLRYKAELVGIQVEVREESYTSKASFVDLDPIPTYKPNDEEERITRLNQTKSAMSIDVHAFWNYSC